ncbi:MULTISPECIES: Tn3 family transposase [Actinomadura]|uniref:Tn3 family transposase n=1 Tax=Actinomadura sp. NPDC000929 TaxID=3154517 RepID=UPI0033935FF5
MFVAEYVASPELRREIHEGLQVVENWNSAKTTCSPSAPAPSRAATRTTRKSPCSACTCSSPRCRSPEGAVDLEPLTNHGWPRR